SGDGGGCRHPGRDRSGQSGPDRSGTRRWAGGDAPCSAVVAVLPRDETGPVTPTARGGAVGAFWGPVGRGPGGAGPAPTVPGRCPRLRLRPVPALVPRAPGREWSGRLIRATVVCVPRSCCCAAGRSPYRSTLAVRRAPARGVDL